MFMRHLASMLAPLILCVGAVAGQQPLFPFVISYDARPNVTNVSAWLDRPAGKHGFVHSQQGRLVTDAGPIRFWATNLCFEACFPSHEQAERVAARLASLGINCVRMHHMDASAIWGDSPNKTTIDPKKLERLDYLIYQLKQHGIYTDLNLHVSRWLGEAEGFTAQKQRPNYDKGVGNFEPRMIQLQQKYARDLLTHVNPYTKAAYSDEPAVAFVEISNEDALFAIWSGNQLDTLPEPYATTFRKLWNVWLRTKYGSTQQLRRAWKAADVRLEDQSVPVMRHGDLGLTEAGRNDFVDFLWDTERDYWWGMYRFLKDELRVRPLVSGTQLGYSPVHIQAGLDYIDAHAYWNHPRFPGRPWDPKNWTVRNVALVNSPGGTLASLAARRVAGMPYTVSEYNHPEPNQYAAEGFPMIAAFGAFQSWDGIFSFAYSHSTDLEPRKITTYFNINSPTPRLAHMPACAAMFLRGDVAPAKQSVVAPLSAEAERKKLHETLSARKLTADNLGLDPQLCLLHAMAMDIGKTGPPYRRPLNDPLPPDRRPLNDPLPPYRRPLNDPLPPDRTALPPDRTAAAASLPKDAAQFVSDTGQIRWDVTQQGAGFFAADSPRTKLFTGFVGGRTFSLGNVQLRILSTRLDWATVSLVCIDGDGFDKPGRMLIAATGLAQNQGAELQQLGGDNVTLGNQWGSEPILCEGVPAEITLPVENSRVRFYPLDESGNRREAVATAVRDGKTVLPLDPKHKTVWYEVEIR